MPKLPKTVPSLLGNIPVIVEPEAKTRSGTPTMGRFDEMGRCIVINAALEPTTARMTLYHEQIEALFFDTGVTYLLKPKQKEAVCDCLAMALVKGLLR